MSGEDVAESEAVVAAAGGAGAAACGRGARGRGSPAAAVAAVEVSERGAPTVRELIREAGETDSVERIVALAKHEDAAVRLAAVKQVCPCRVKADVDAFWLQIFSMVSDSDVAVRWQVLHTVCDGSPTHLESSVAEALDVFNRDPDAEVRRRAHKVLSTYRRTGKWNVL